MSRKPNERSVSRIRGSVTVSDADNKKRSKMRSENSPLHLSKKELLVVLIKAVKCTKSS